MKRKLNSDKVCQHALSMIKFLGTLHMKKLDLKYEPRLRRAAFIEWISQLEIAFSSNKYTKNVLKDYSTKNKINKSDTEMTDLLIYTVAYAFMDKATRMSTINYKGQGSKLLKVLHMKCASVDENTKLRAKMQFLSCRIGNEETAINFLTRLEQKANEARNYDIRISEKRFLWVLLNNKKHHIYYKERIASFLTTFELNPSTISQRWIENKFYSMDEERMQIHRFKFTRESARFSSSSGNKQRDNFTRKPSKNSLSPKGKTIRCKYCYRLGHHDSQCRQKEAKRPPSMPDWVSKAICKKCNKKGHLSFNCPPKYDNKPYKTKNPQYNKKETSSETAARVSEFAGSATHKDQICHAICRQCSNKGHLSTKCYPEYRPKSYKTRNISSWKNNNRRNVNTTTSHFDDSSAKHKPNQRMIPNYKSPEFAYINHLHIMENICKNSPNSANIKFQKILQYLHNNDPRINSYKHKVISFFMSNFNKMSQKDLITIIWVLCHLHSSKVINLDHNRKQTSFKRSYQFKGRKHKRKSNYPVSHTPTYNMYTSPINTYNKRRNDSNYSLYSGIGNRTQCHHDLTNNVSASHKNTNKYKRNTFPSLYFKHNKNHKIKDSHPQTAYTSQHELSSRNNFPASNLEKGWIIDSGASAHMTPFRKDCTNIQPTYKLIYLADGSTVLCKFMGHINIPIKENGTEIGTLILEDVLIVPNLDRRLFSVNAFLSKGHNWVHFTQNYIKLGIKNGPSLNIPITSLQSNAFIVDHTKCHPKDYANQVQDKSPNNNNIVQDKKTKINTNVLHDRLHRPDGVLATIQAHNLWRDVEVTQGIDHMCTSCKIMTIPAHARGKTRKSQVTRPLDEIQVDTVPNPEPMGLSADTRFKYFLIFCDRYSRTFRLCGIKDKSTEACIDGIELIISNLSLHQRKPHTIRHVRSDAGSEFRSDTFRKWCGENQIQFSSAAPKHQEQNGSVE